jgi:hypothetical protein
MLTLTTTIRNTMTDAIVDSVDAGGAGTIEIRSGTRPADPATTATGTLLATVALSATAFGSASSGAATIVDPAAVTAVATGTATWFRAKSGGGTAQFDGLVTATGGGGDLTLTTTSIVSGMSVDVTGGTITVPQGTTP